MSRKESFHHGHDGEDLAMIREILEQIQPLDNKAMAACQARLDNLTKPLNSLAGFEKLAVQLAGITRQDRPHQLRKSIILMAADHGVAVEGVSAYPPEVTAQMVANFCQGGAAINTFAAHMQAGLVLVDIGVAGDVPAMPGLIGAKIAAGTANMTQEPAMTREQVLAAVTTGITVACEQLRQGVRVIGLGEMGIGNTTPSTAIVACYSSQQLDCLTGRGTGINDDGWQRKVQVIGKALAVNNPDPLDPLDVLAKVGGLEIAGLTGVVLAAAAHQAAVVLDGLNTSAAALIACRLHPHVRHYLIGSHYSVEPAHQEALQLMGVPAYLHLDMRLGEGTGAALGMSLIDASLHVLNDMKTFGEAQVAIAQDGPGAVRQSQEK